MKRSKRAHLSLAAVAMLALGSVCEPIAATQVVVRFSADAALRPLAARLDIEVRNREGEVVLDRSKTLTGTEAELARVPIVPRDDDASRFFTIRGELFDAAGGSLGVQRAMSGYVEDALMEIVLVFDEACAGVPDCGDGRSCRSGVCIGACMEPAPAGSATPSRLLCSACEQCAARRCEPLPDGTACGCEGDQCAAGACVVARPVRAVVTGRKNTCAVLEDDDAYCWGANDYGQLGVGDGVASASSPELAYHPTSFWRSFGAGTDFLCGLQGEELRFCWGANFAGEFGTGTRDGGSSTPVVLDTPLFRELSTGGSHVCGLEDSGAIQCWGYNARGQVGIGVESEAEPIPAQVGSDTDWIQLEAGSLHTCARKRDQSLWCWGYNDSGQIGVGDAANRTSPAEVGCTPGLEEVCFHDWVAVSAGEYHTCAIRADSSLWCWGGNGNAQLGIGTTESNESRPRPVEPGVAWSTVEAGFHSTCAVREADGSLWCWGLGDQGELGVGDRERRSLPALVAAPDDRARWEQVSIARGGPPEPVAGHACAIRSDRTLWCWGRNAEGQLGIGTEGESVLTPRRVCFPAPP